MRAKIVLILLVCPWVAAEETPDDQDWPRILRMDGGGKLIIHAPQVEQWKEFSTLDLSAAVTVETDDDELLGAMRMRLTTAVDIARRVALVSNAELVRLDLPGASEELTAKVGKQLIDYVRSGSPEVQLDDIFVGMDPTVKLVREVEIDVTPPNVILSQKAAILICFDGAPKTVAIAGTDLLLAANSPSLLFQHARTGWWYLLGGDVWFKTGDLRKGPWVPAPQLPSTFGKLPDDELWGGLKKLIPGRKIERKDMPTVHVAFEPTELLITFGAPTFKPIKDTSLTYVDNTESDIFLNSKDGLYYVLFSGRWYRTRGNDHPLEFCTHDLPADFARIDPEHAAGRVLASVPGTEQAKDALLGNTLPRQATVARGAIKLEIPHKGQPRFAPIEGTGIEVASNVGVDLFRIDGGLYCCSDGIWFAAQSVNGPWKLCDKLPEAFAKIPATSPYFNVSYVRIVGATDKAVTYAYTTGYFGCFANRGVVVWGTGRRHKWSDAGWQAAWDARDYWLKRWRRDELHQWFRHLTFGQGRWYDHLTGLYRVNFDSMMHAKFRTHQAQAYRTWNGTAVLPTEKREVPKPEPVAKPKKKRAVVAKSRANLYAGPNGKVYKYSYGVWFRQEGERWLSLSGRPELKGDAERREKLERARAARSRSYGIRRRNRGYRSRYRRRGLGLGWAYYGGGIDIGGGGWGGAGWGGGGDIGGIGIGGW